MDAGDSLSLVGFGCMALRYARTRWHARVRGGRMGGNGKGRKGGWAGGAGGRVQLLSANQRRW